MERFEYIMVKDMHLMFSFRNNIRKSGWEINIDKKINQMIEYCLDNDIKYIITTGDIFEKQKAKDWSFTQFQANKKRLQWIKDAGLTLISNAGNHDYFFGKESISGTVFGEMVNSQLIRYIGTNSKPIKINNVEIYGIDYHNDIDIILDSLHRISAIATSNITNIVIMHSNITDSPQKITDFTYKQLSEFNIDTICCGHWHLSPEKGAIQTINNTTFLNPWNMTRVVREYHTQLDEHKPSFIHGSVTRTGTTYTEIPFIITPFSETFNPVVLNFTNKESFNFFENIDLFKETDISDDDTTVLDTLAKNNNISEASLGLAKEMLL